MDGGHKYGFSHLEHWAAKHGIIVEPTAPYNPHQNGLVERSIGLVCTMARTMLLDSGLPLYLWPEAILMAVEILNTLPSDALNGAVPFTLQDEQNHAPRMDFLRRFGQACLVHIPEETRLKSAKFSERSEKGFIVGCKGTAIYRIWIPTGYGFGKVVESSSVAFDSIDLYKNENKIEKPQQDEVLDFNEEYPLQLNNGSRNMPTSSKLGGERTCDSDVEDEEPLYNRNSAGNLISNPNKYFLN